MKYKVRVLSIVKTTNTRYRLDLELPFAPNKDTCITKSGCIIDIGPFDKVTYNLSKGGSFYCHMFWDIGEKPDYETMDRLHNNVTQEGWKRED